jgi:hypothetical protein
MVNGEGRATSIGGMRLIGPIKIRIDAVALNERERNIRQNTRKQNKTSTRVGRDSAQGFKFYYEPPATKSLLMFVQWHLI